MIPYLVCFTMTPLFTYFSEKSIKAKKYYRAIIYAIIAILIPSIIAGVRHMSVGVDGEVYVRPYFNLFKTFTLKDVILRSSNYNLEPLFGILLYICGFFSNNPNIVLFIIQILITTVLYWTAYRNRNEMSMTIFMLVYSLVFFAKSLNIMRQSISLAFFILSLSYLKEGNLKNTFISFFIAMLFHTSIIILSILYMLYFLNKKNNSTVIKITFLLAILFFIIIFSMFLNEIISFLVNIEILPERYYMYSQQIESVDFNFSWLMYNFLLLCISFYISSIESRDSKINAMNFTMFESTFIAFLFLIIMLFVGNSGEIYRISYSFLIVGIMELFPQIYRCLKNDNTNYIMGTFIMALILSAFFYLSFVFVRQAKIYPFRFQETIIKEEVL